jgi:ABC-type glycerol-3-phosphate transport system permease component
MRQNTLPQKSRIIESETQRSAREMRHRVRSGLRSLASHAVIIVIGLFFLVPFLWMVLTAFKSEQDVSHTPPRWLPYDYKYATVNGQKYPMYRVKTENGVQELAAVKIAEGVGTFVDPANPDQPIEVKLQQGQERMAEAIMVVSFRLQNFPDAMQRGSRPTVGTSFWVYFKNSLIVAFFAIVGTLFSNTPWRTPLHASSSQAATCYSSWC